MTLDAIGKEMGIHPTRVHVILKDVLAMMNQKLVSEMHELVTLEETRLDELLSAAWPKAKAGDIRAVEAVLRVMERRARLRGLDKQQGPAGSPIPGLTDAELLAAAQMYGIPLSETLSAQLKSSVPVNVQPQKGDENGRELPSANNGQP